ncbi:PREDICTED: GDSL esterase/lipase At2g42990-like [Populus euphratica]|uniref:GDSL esterase/lipase At2g42990-like n=1 Tax=Populus euphratica TaxID=75702 RepID=A0AAJ6VCV9_POPEU|nr:PREDICTED: GDSL esterase/lipase At2g42990-like [Populus euphratica]
MGCLPMERATNFMHPNICVKEYNDLALEFNGKLNQLVPKLNDELPGMKVLFSNPQDLLLQLITASSLYGFENAEVGCCGPGTFEMGIMCAREHPLTCTDAAKYVIWDAFHLTDRTNQIISAYLFKDLKSKFL